jgi:cytochrome c oxidase cbb3-type subunit III
MSEEKDELLNHEYDGIQEYNNPLPMWWLWTFFGTIIFGFIYYLHYTTNSGPNLQQELDLALNDIKQRQSHASKQGELQPEDLAAQIKSADLQSANSLFQTRCTACHGNVLQGGIGPNLTDANWIHGKGTAPEIIKVIKEGVVDNGMPAWGSMLHDKELIQLTALILSKQDSNPPGAKAPQGEKVR